MSDEEFIKEFESMNKEDRDELIFKALGGTKKKGKYVVDIYYKGLGYYIGGWYANDLIKVIDEMQKFETKHLTWSDLPQIKKAQEKYGVRYSNDIMSGNKDNPFIQFFVCNPEDLRLF